jgi:hypothetical protein
MSWTPDYQFRASYVLWHLRSFTQMNFREFVAAHESVCVLCAGFWTPATRRFRTLNRPASKKRQGTKSREVRHRLSSEHYGDL